MTWTGKLNGGDIFINKNTWNTFSEGEMDSYVDSVFDYYRENGFPFYPTDKAWRRNEFGKLRRYDRKSIISPDGVLKQTMHGLALAWSYHPHSFSVRCGTLRSPMDVFCDTELFKKAIRKRLKIGDNISDAGIRKILRIYSGTQGVSNFRPTTAGAIYDKYSGDGVVWDMSMGYGGRMLGAFVSGVKVYYGNDPCLPTFNGLLEMANDFSNGTKYDLSLNGSELGHPNIKDNGVDLCFTSPPYFDWEKYSDEPTQSYKRFPDRESWVSGFVDPTIANCMRYLKTGGRLIINVAGTKNFKDLHDVFKRRIVNAGFVEDTDNPLRLSLSALNSGGFKFEPCLTFRKT